MVPTSQGVKLISCGCSNGTKGKTARPARIKLRKWQPTGLVCSFFFLYGTALKVKSSKQLKITFLASLDMKGRSLMWSQTFSNTSTAQASVTPWAKQSKVRSQSFMKNNNTHTIKLTAFLKEHTVLKTRLCSQFQMRIVFTALQFFWLDVKLADWTLGSPIHVRTRTYDSFLPGTVYDHYTHLDSII